MARQKGKSGSTKPLSSKPPSWVTHGSKETLTLVKKLDKQGYSPSKIGLILRDSYGIPDVKAVTGKKISEIVEKKDLPEDLTNMINTIIVLKKHMDKNKKDKHSKKSFENINSKLRKMVKYYVKVGRLPKGWTFNLEEAEKLV